MAMTWKLIRAHERHAAQIGDDLVVSLGLAGPTDPLAIAKEDYPFLRVIGHNLGNRCDGRLEYHPHKSCFLLLFNSKYDDGLPEGKHHPRTRFSVAHELGHFFLDHHRAYLLGGGPAHESKAEYAASDEVLVEREADAFASALLLPRHLVDREIQKELTRSVVEGIAQRHKVSRMATIRRCVELSHYPCAVVCIRDGMIVWRRHSDSLIDLGCWPSAWRDVRSGSARRAWEELKSSGECLRDAEAKVGEWFSTYGREDIDQEYVTEIFFPIPVMRSLVVLLCVDEELGRST